MVRNVHNNYGHPSKEEFLRALRLSRARPEVLDNVRREFDCPACAAKGHPPKPRLPAAMPWTFRFNETLGVDLFEDDFSDGTKIIFCNVVCWGTLYQLCIPILAKLQRRCPCASPMDPVVWSSHFGHCRPRKGVCGHRVQRVLECRGVLLLIIGVRAPHGDIYKRIFERTRWMHSPSGPAALQRLALECNAAKNRLSSRSGYSLLQRVFGIGHRLPAAVTTSTRLTPSLILQLWMQVLRSPVRFAKPP